MTRYEVWWPNVSLGPGPSIPSRVCSSLVKDWYTQDCGNEGCGRRWDFFLGPGKGLGRTVIAYTLGTMKSYSKEESIRNHPP